MKEDNKIRNVLTNKIVTIRYIKDVTSRYPQGHVLYGGLHTDGGIELKIRRVDGMIVPFLTKEEIASLEQHLQEDLSYSNDRFWKDSNRFVVKLINGDIQFDLSKPIDYIKYKFLKMYDKLIAPSWERRKDILTYKWAFIEENEAEDTTIQNMSMTAQAYMLFGKYQNHKEVLSYLYHKIENKHVDANIKLPILQSWFKPIFDNKATIFVKFAEDKLIEEKALLSQALKKGIITKQGEANLYYYNGVRLSDDGKAGGEDMAAKFISDINNQSVKMELMAKVRE